MVELFGLLLRGVEGEFILLEPVLFEMFVMVDDVLEELALAVGGSFEEGVAVAL